MTVTIQEVLTSTTNTITWSEIASHDVAFVTQHWFDDGSGVSAVDGEATGWQRVFYGGHNGGWWKHYTTGAESPVETFVTSHIASFQMIGVRMRSDEASGINPFIDEYVEWGGSQVTDFANDPVLVFEGSDSGIGDITCNRTLVTLATMANVALYRTDPFQVPLGTTISISGTPELINQQAGAIAFRAWRSGVVVPPVVAGGWAAWIID